MQLCQICNGANGSTFEAGQCYICEEKAMKTDEMITTAIRFLKDENATNFSISTIIPKDWQNREEMVWDRKLSKAESIKNILNRKIVSAINATGLIYDIDGDFRVVFNYYEGKIELQKNNMFIFGRYKKISAGLSQSRWRCPKCGGEGTNCNNCSGKGKCYESVEERIGEPIKEAAQAKDYVMHASGREDVDATNTAGRAFVFEIKEPSERKLNLVELTKIIGKSNEVEVCDLQVVRRKFIEMVTESHFDKTYDAEIEFGREITENDERKILELAGETLLQQTPTRVAHRRANLVRHRKVKTIEVKNRDKNKATIIVKAEAGTYIKELISGDNGRTNPSISKLLGTSAVCKKLEVTKIEDGFLDFCLAK
ncbi:MAG: tRNA pseudouridine(54/55) synthase Pus10 [Candidatus Micrarchaeota archaeon]